MTVCDAGKFGRNCMSDCHCLDTHPCNHIDGSCTPDLCTPGWWGYNCSMGMAFMSDLRYFVRIPWIQFYIL